MAIVTPNMSLTAWNISTDEFDYVELANNWTAVDEHNHTPGKGLLIPADGIATGAVTNSKIGPGAISGDKLAAGAVTTSAIPDNAITTPKINDLAVTTAKLADAEKLGISDASTIRRGKSIIATEESRTNTSYGTLATADQVLDVVLPTEGLIFIAYQALWKQTVANAARAAIFLDSDQVKQQFPTAPSADEANITTNTNTYQALYTHYGGLKSSDSGTAYTSDVTTGQIIGDAQTGGLGGLAVLFAAAGTYTVTVQFKSIGSGTVTAKERKLWVWTVGF